MNERQQRESRGIEMYSAETIEALYQADKAQIRFPSVSRNHLIAILNELENLDEQKLLRQLEGLSQAVIVDAIKQCAAWVEAGKP